MFGPFLVVLLQVARAAEPSFPARPPEAGTTCAGPAPVSAVVSALSGAEAAWGVDEAAFAAGADAARAALRCLGTPVPGNVAARLHRVEGLAAFLARDLPRAGAAFAAARALEPDYTFPVDMVPEQNPVRVAYDMATPNDTPRRVPPAARVVTLVVDGSSTRRVPADRAAVVQVFQAGAAVSGEWVLPGEPLPAYRLRGEGLRAPLLVVAGGLAAGAAVLWGFEAGAEAATFDAAPVDRATREASQDTANVLSAATIGVGAAALGTGAAAFLFARW